MKWGIRTKYDRPTVLDEVVVTTGKPCRYEEIFT